jgi:hypothetical protein
MQTPVALFACYSFFTEKVTISWINRHFFYYLINQDIGGLEYDALCSKIMQALAR